jgi:hypothetical protein
MQLVASIEAEAAPGSIVALLDLWTSQAWDDFLGMTICYIAIDTNTDLPVLRGVKIACNHRDVVGLGHTGAAIAQWAHGILAQWRIRPFVYVVDNGSNLADNFLNTMTQLGYEMFRSQCSGHTLNLCVKGCLTTRNVKPTWMKVKRVSLHFHHSVKATELLNSLQATRHPLRLPQFGATRWLSAEPIFTRIVDLRAPITTAIDRILGQNADDEMDAEVEEAIALDEEANEIDPAIPLPQRIPLQRITDREWLTVTALSVLLGYMRTEVNALQGASYATYPWIVVVVTRLHALVDNEGSLFREVLEANGLNINNSTGVQEVHRTLKRELEVRFCKSSFFCNGNSNILITFLATLSKCVE